MEILHITAAFLIALVSGLGIGGGGLFTIYLTLVGGISQLTAQGFSLIFFLFCSSASVVIQLRRGKIRMREVTVMALAGICGALLGVWVAGAISEEYLRRAFGAMLITGGIISLRSMMGCETASQK